MADIQSRLGLDAPAGPVTIDGVNLGEIDLHLISEDMIRIATIHIHNHLRGQGFGHLVMQQIAEAANCQRYGQKLVTLDQAAL